MPIMKDEYITGFTYIEYETLQEYPHELSDIGFLSIPVQLVIISAEPWIIIDHTCMV